MDELVHIWKLEGPYLWFQVVYTCLTLNFLIPAVSYFFKPEIAVNTFALLGKPFGKEYACPEDSKVWRVLGAGNVLTLGFMCLLLQLNIRFWFPVIVPLVFMKSAASIGYLFQWLFRDRFPGFFFVFCLDGLAVFLMLFFGIRAHIHIMGL